MTQRTHDFVVCAFLLFAGVTTAGAQNHDPRALTLAAQDKTDQLGEVRSRFERAWLDADIQLTSSRY